MCVLGQEHVCVVSCATEIVLAPVGKRAPEDRQPTQNHRTSWPSCLPVCLECMEVMLLDGLGSSDPQTWWKPRNTLLKSFTMCYCRSSLRGFSTVKWTTYGLKWPRKFSMHVLLPLSLCMVLLCNVCPVLFALTLGHGDEASWRREGWWQHFHWLCVHNERKREREEVIYKEGYWRTRDMLLLWGWVLLMWRKEAEWGRGLVISSWEWWVWFGVWKGSGEKERERLSQC